MKTLKKIFKFIKAVVTCFYSPVMGLAFTGFLYWFLYASFFMIERWTRYIIIACAIALISFLWAVVEQLPMAWFYFKREVKGIRPA